MKMSSLSILHLGYERFKSSLPRRMQVYVKQLLGWKDVTSSQSARIQKLGESIGLEKSEIIEATNLPIDNMDTVGRGKIGVVGVMVAIFVVMCVSFAVVIMMAGGNLVDPVATPTYTYAPGTRYGSIAPRDFSK